jgi:hypothetical protein
VNCGYDLSGSAVGGVCPECGTPVKSSIHQGETDALGTGRAVTCMVLGILSLMVCGILGPFAILHYHRYCRQVAQGRVSNRGMAMAKAGLITGWVGIVCLLVQCIVFWPFVRTYWRS